MTKTRQSSNAAPTHVRIMGVPIARSLALEVSARLRDKVIFDTAEAIETALTHGIPIVRLTLDDCEAILSVLRDPPPQLVLLRDVLLDLHARRMRDVGGPYQDYPADPGALDDTNA